MSKDSASGDEMSSDLGTLDYWENSYSVEIENFKGHGDIGEVWFGRESSSKIIKFVDQLIDFDKENEKIVDLGCGNGYSLLDFAKNGYKNLTGIDYSQQACNLAKQVLKSKGFNDINIIVMDITDTCKYVDDFNFRIVHDKGTYDAISLCPQDSIQKREMYKKNLKNILSENGYFIITSCNWTTEELVQDFKNDFKLFREIPTKTMTFGGVKGQTISQLIFQKST